MKYLPKITKSHLFVIAFLAVAVGFAIIGKHNTAVQQKPYVPLSAPQPTPGPSKVYVSEKLGVSFSYSTIVSGRVNFFVREIGNKIYLYYDLKSKQQFEGTDEEFINMLSQNGYSIEVFNKEPHQSLKESIKQQFLSGYSDKDCFVSLGNYGHPRLDDSYLSAIIGFPRNPKAGRLELEPLFKKCPKYTKGFEINYFMMNPKYPDKLLFIRLGNDNILSGIGGYTWDQTIKILN